MGRKKGHRPAEALVAGRQGESLLDGQIDLAADVQEAGPGIQDLAQPAALAAAQPGRAGQGLAGQGARALAGVNAAADRQAVGPQALDGVGMELDVGVDPEGFFVAVGQGVGDDLAAADVDLGIAAHPPHGIAAALEFDQALFASRRHVRGEGHQNHAPPRVHSDRPTIAAPADRVAGKAMAY